LYKHGVGYFEREGTVEGDAALTLTFKQSEVSDVLKSLTVLDLDGGHITAVSYDSTKPIEQLLSEIALSIPDRDSLMALVPQLKGARVLIQPEGKAKPVEGAILGVDLREIETANGVSRQSILSILGDEGEVMSFDLYKVGMQLLDPSVKRDLDFYLKTQLSAKKKDARGFTLFAAGEGSRTVRVSYVLEAPVWKATYRILLNADDEPPLIQGWAVVDNMQDDDWEEVQLSLIAGLPVSFRHDLYTPRYIRRPTVQVRETTGVLPPEIEGGFATESVDSMMVEFTDTATDFDALERAPVSAMMSAPVARRRKAATGGGGGYGGGGRSEASSMPTQTRERQIGDLFEYQIERPVSIRRNQSALVPIVLKPFAGRTVLLYQKQARAENPMRCVEFENTTGLTLEGGPVTVLDEGSYVGEAMLDTMKPTEQRLIGYAVELAVRVTDSIKSHNEDVLRVTINRGVMKTHYSTIDTTTYTFANKADRDAIVYLDHPRPDRETKLIDTPQPHEITENYWRFKFVLAKNSTAKYPVKTQRAIWSSISLASIDEKTLNLWVAQKYIDKPTQKVLAEVVKLRGEMANIERQIDRLTKEREQIHTEQKRIRENLQSLGDRSSEKELRERFVRTLNTQEDRLEQIGPEIAARVKELETARGGMERLLEELKFEGNVG